MSEASAAVAVIYLPTQPPGAVNATGSPSAGSVVGPMGAPRWPPRRQRHLLAQTAWREVGEEKGFTYPQTPRDPATTICRSTTKQAVLVAPFMWEIDHEPTLKPDPAEVAEARWLDCRQLDQPTNHPQAIMPAAQNSVLYPYIQVDDTPLWGFTWRVLTDWWNKTHCSK